MKILHISPSYFSAESVIGGAERYAFELARAMSEREETRILTFGSEKKTEVQGRLKVIRLKSFLDPEFFGQILWADIVHCHQIYRPETDAAILWSRLCGKKVFATDLGGLGRYSLAYHVPILRLLSGFLSISEFGEKSWYAKASGKLPDFHRVIGGGVDLTRFNPGSAQKTKKVLYVGRLLSHKGIDLLIDACGTDTELEIVGNSYDPEYDAVLLKKSEGRKVRFYKGLADADLIRKYREAAVTVLPSVYQDCFGRKSEAPELLGLTPLESMACGTPAIVSDTASLPEVVRDGETGFVVPGGNSAALAEKIKLVLENPEQAARMGENGTRFVKENFTWHRTVENCLQAYGIRSPAQPKVAFVMPTHFSPHSVIAGGERFAYGLAKAMSELTETAIVTFGTEDKTVQDGNLTIRYCRTLCAVGGIANPLSFAHLSFLKKYDVIHCLQFPTLVTEFAALAGAWRGRRVFVTDLAGGTHYCLSKVFPVANSVREFLLISEFNRGLNHWIRKPSRIIYGGVDTSFFTPAGERPGEPRFLYVGRIFRGKGIHDLIEALPENAALDIAGQCHEPDYLEELKRNSQGKNVTFHDSPSDDEILAMYRRARALVLPSLVDGGFTSAMEAQACGVPVIGTKIGSLPEVVLDGATGFLTQPANVSELRDRLVYALQHPEKLKVMGEKGRERMLTEFTWEQTARRCLRAYLE